MAELEGGIVALLGAVDALKTAGMPLRWNLKVLLDGEEESSSTGLKAVADANRARFAADLLLMLLILLGLPPFLLWGSLLLLSRGWIGVSILVLLFVTRHAILRTLHRKLFRDPPAFSPVLSLIAEFLQPLHLGHASLTRVIIWRSRRIRVGARGTFTFLPDRSP